jgi:hypothetical protein
VSVDREEDDELRRATDLEIKRQVVLAEQGVAVSELLVRGEVVSRMHLQALSAHQHHCVVGTDDRPDEEGVKSTFGQVKLGSSGWWLMI